jgi:hypothetical protein
MPEFRDVRFLLARLGRTLEQRLKTGVLPITPIRVVPPARARLVLEIPTVRTGSLGGSIPGCQLDPQDHRPVRFLTELDRACIARLCIGLSHTVDAHFLPDR